MKKLKISAIIVTRDEEAMIRDCLKSLTWVDEIIVIDQSKDNTPQIAREYGAKVIAYKSKDFSDRRNKGFREAKGDWIFYIDADERVPEDLVKEILSTINKPEFSAYAIPRENIILGKTFHHGGFGGFDYVKRLFKKDTFRMWTGKLHEEPNYLHEGKLTKGDSESLGHLSNKLTHVKHENIAEMIEKTNEWSGVEAMLMFEAKHPPMTVSRFFSAIFREFWFRMIVKAAFLDGVEGVMFALYQVFSRFVSYAKLWELQQKRS